MTRELIKKTSDILSLPLKSVESTANLLDEGATVPFISRYRKEATGSLDEVAIISIRDTLARLEELEKRRETIITSIEDQDKMDDQLRRKILAAETIAELEDIYLPYRPKRKTRGLMAQEKGLEPLAVKIFAQKCNPLVEAENYISPEKGVDNIEQALAGARDIIAEKISEHSAIRQKLRNIFLRRATLSSKVSKGMENEGAKFRDWFDWSEPAAKAPGHRILALLRGEREKVLKISIRPDADYAIDLISKTIVRGYSPASQQVSMALSDSYKRLLAPQMETELRSELLKKAETQAISVFASNLRKILLAAPLGNKRIMALDPGFRTGAKLVCLDAQGQLLHYDNIFPTTSQSKKAEAAETVKKLVAEFSIEAIAIGNGTAGRETESFVKELNLPSDIEIVMVNESGASVYSASEVAREEFPDYDVTVRGAVSIGRRLMDPLAELVKIDPKSIGVGQYQHDVDQNSLKNSLDEVVMSCVNKVGVELNTASSKLLQYVSGLGPVLAKNIIKFRDENGPFKSRKELLKVQRLGPKAFEQSAGFLRIKGAADPLDESAVHPERYKLVAKMAADCGVDVSKLMNSDEARSSIDPNRYISDEVGLPTLKDIISELAKPGRDPREKFSSMHFDESVKEISDLSEGMVLPGIVTNVTAFGAFVDIGVHQDGLVHISQLSDTFIKNPAEFVYAGMNVQVKVLEVDEARKRISLSMKGLHKPQS
jgi:uncharacterized protein